MSTTSTVHPVHDRTLSRGTAVLVWTLQIALAALFVFSGGNKLAGNPMMVQMFDAIGIGQWFRYFTGTLEVAGGVGLLVPRFAPLAAAVLAVVMLGAIVTHLFIIGGSPALPIALLIALSAVLYLRRHQVGFLRR